MKNKPIKIAFDASQLIVTKKTGVGKYTEGLISALSRAGGDEIELIGYYYNFLGRKRSLTLPKSPNIRYRPVLLVPGPVINLLRRFGIEMPIELLTLTKCDIALYPNYLTHPSIFKAKTIAVIHDLTYKYFPESMSEKNQRDLERFVPVALRRSAALLAVSETTKKDITKEYAYSQQILVTPVPFEPKNGQKLLGAEETKDKFGIKKDYLLFVGTLEPRKNVIELVNTYSGSDALKSKYALVLCGGKDWKYEATMLAIEKARADGAEIIVTGYVDDIARDSLYKNCTVFVSTSLYEGFGMPLLEALAFKKPVAVSDIPIFHEVMQDSAYYFKLGNAKDISGQILAAANSTKTKYPPYSLITWDTVGKNVLSLIKKIANNNHANK